MAIAHLVGVPGAEKGVRDAHQTDLRTINTLSHTHSESHFCSHAQVANGQLPREGKGGRGGEGVALTSNQLHLFPL